MPYLQRQLEVLDPAVVVTLGRFSMAHFRQGERITQIHGTHVPAPPSTGARDALAFAMFHPAAALRGAEVERQSYDDIAALPRVLRVARARRAQARTGTSVEPDPAGAKPAEAPAEPALAPPPTTDSRDDAPTLF